MSVGPVSVVVQAFPNDTGRPRKRRLAPRRDQDEPIDAEFTIIDDGPGTFRRRGTATTHMGATAQGAPRSLQLASRSRRDQDTLGVLAAYLPYQEYRGAYVDAFV
jgi:hypothetical protein